MSLSNHLHRDPTKSPKRVTVLAKGTNCMSSSSSSSESIPTSVMTQVFFPLPWSIISFASSRFLRDHVFKGLRFLRGHVFLRDPKGGGGEKSPVNRNENLQPPPPPSHKKWYASSLLHVEERWRIWGSFFRCFLLWYFPLLFLQFWQVTCLLVSISKFRVSIDLKISS